MYSVVASKPSLNIYRIRDRYGNEQVVHRNLLLPVNVLPLPETELNFSAGRSGVTNPGSTPFQSVCIQTEPAVPVTDDLSAAESMSDISHIAVFDDDCTALWVVFHSLKLSLKHRLSVVDLDTVASVFFAYCSSSYKFSCSCRNHLTTRFGRVIKPVCRLIESMVQLETIFSIDSGSPFINVVFCFNGNQGTW